MIPWTPQLRSVFFCYHWYNSNSIGLGCRYLAWYWYCHIQILSIIQPFSFLCTTMLNMLFVPLYRVLWNYSKIDRNIKRVENRLDTTDSSVSEFELMSRRTYSYPIKSHLQFQSILVQHGDRSCTSNMRMHLGSDYLSRSRSILFEFPLLVTNTWNWDEKIRSSTWLIAHLKCKLVMLRLNRKI
jgi:hypothetical protein